MSFTIDKNEDILDIIKNNYDFSENKAAFEMLDSFLKKYNKIFKTKYDSNIFSVDEKLGSFIDSDVIKVGKAALLSFYATYDSDISKIILNTFIKCKINGNSYIGSPRNLSSIDELDYVEKVIIASKIIVECESNKRDLFQNYDEDLYCSSLCFLFEEFDKTHY